MKLMTAMIFGEVVPGVLWVISGILKLLPESNLWLIVDILPSLLIVISIAFALFARKELVDEMAEEEYAMSYCHGYNAFLVAMIGAYAASVVLKNIIPDFVLSFEMVFPFIYGAVSIVVGTKFIRMERNNG